MKAKRRKIIHACACCQKEFPSRKACWAHLDAGCPKRGEVLLESPLGTQQLACGNRVPVENLTTIRVAKEAIAKATT